MMPRTDSAPTLEAPRGLIESFAGLRFPPKTDARMQWLMSQNTEGKLQPLEREELESLVDLSEELSLLRAQAMQLLG
jgi:hypothetical protein